MTTRTKTNKPTLVPLEKHCKSILSAINEWEATNTPEQIRQDVFAHLNAQKRQITLALLGLTDKWGALEIGHGDNNPIKKFIIEESQKAVIEFVKTLPVLELTPKEKLTILKEAHAQFVDRINREIYSAVQSKVKKAVEEELAALMQSPDLEGLINLRKLITGVTQ